MLPASYRLLPETGTAPFLPHCVVQSNHRDSPNSSRGNIDLTS